ncbi:hypothetical protein EYF80_021481 [Liparis tanakae]|uniref:Uncharacterized protein n=1 Tax=Liparis tanakae TaxID=230148 RepID=A0A4Z2HRC5_9TELE|nr:hypothetical protein EYF80_021481 [Liparis tanakae]
MALCTKYKRRNISTDNSSSMSLRASPCWLEIQSGAEEEELAGKPTSQYVPTGWMTQTSSSRSARETPACPSLPAVAVRCSVLCLSGLPFAFLPSWGGHSPMGALCTRPCSRSSLIEVACLTKALGF